MDNPNFKWPDSPPYPAQSWFELTGAELGMEPDHIRFAAALITLGGPDSRNNSLAGELAGLDLDRTQAFRLARSVRVRKLIDNAELIKTGKRQPLTEDQIDQRIDKMILSPNDLSAAKGIELRTRRQEAKEKAQPDLVDIWEELRLIAQISPEMAEAYAQHKGVTWHADGGPNKPDGSDENR